jgi:hypothetical protein
MKLKSGSAFFSKESYSVVFKKDGYEPKKVNVECKLNGWYFGNILIGGLIGMLIVDPATGAMYKLEGEGITETLSAQKSTTSVPQLKIMNIGDLPADTKARLVKL